MFRSFLFLLLMLAFTSAPARSFNSQIPSTGYLKIASPDFEPGHWSDGLHLLAGVGLNVSSYHSKEENIDGGLGSNLKTDLLYVLNPGLALEWGANVSFHRVQGVLIWDTPLTLGLRFRIPQFLKSDRSAYMRVFTGASPTVVFLNGDTRQLEQVSRYANDSNRIDRLHFNGPVAGIGIGSMKKNSRRQTWYSEFTFTAKWVEQEERISMEGEVPVVVSSSRVDRNTVILTLYWTIGLLAF